MRGAFLPPCEESSMAGRDNWPWHEKDEPVDRWKVVRVALVYLGACAVAYLTCLLIAPETWPR